MKRLPIGRRTAVVLALVLIAAVAVVAVVLGGGESDDGASAREATSSTTPSSPAAPSSFSAAPSPPSAPATSSTTPGEEPVAADQPPPILPAAGLDATVGSDDVVVSIAAIERIQGNGVGPGNIAGPAVRVTVRLTNEQAAAVPIDLVAVSVVHGAEQTPASPLEDPSAEPFRGSLEPGETAEGRYVFSLPADSADLRISVGWRAPAPVAVFTGRG